jgi:hypothetical protein
VDYERGNDDRPHHDARRLVITPGVSLGILCGDEIRETVDSIQCGLQNGQAS